jgi:hypothetical protein
MKMVNRFSTSSVSLSFPRQRLRVRRKGRKRGAEKE